MLLKQKLYIAAMRCTTFSRFTCPEKAILFTSSFRAVNFFLLTQVEKMNFSQLKSSYFCVGQQEKRTARKEPIKRTAILRHVNWLFMVPEIRHDENFSFNELKTLCLN